MDEDDFDFKAMLGTISDPIPIRQSLLDNRLSAHGNSMTRMLTAVPPLASSFSQPARDRSGSGLITVRLRAASDMHQHGFISAEEKSLMKNLILSRNQRFKEEYNHAERTNNWAQLQQMLRSGYFDTNLFSNQSLMQEMEHAFTNLGTPPLWGGNSAPGSVEEHTSRKRMADTTTPVPRVKKNTVPSHPHPPPPPPAAASHLHHPHAHQAHQIRNNEDDEDDSEQVAKLRKNERERQRRLAVSSGFDELCGVLRLPQMSQKDKVSILRNAIDRIKELERRIQDLERNAGM